jgi:hypothetical protein
MRAMMIVVGALFAALLIAQLGGASAQTCADSCQKAYASCTKSCGSKTDCYTKCLNERDSCLAQCK